MTEAEAYTTIEGRAAAEIEEKKSRFIASIAHVETEQEALDFLEEIRAANRMARHNVYAYVLRSADGTGTGGERVRYSDDGEPQKTAGIPTLEAIRYAGLTDVAVVVTRYFGGVLLGTGGLVRAYTQATQAGIAAATRVTVSRCVDARISMAYTFYESAKRLALECGAKVIDERFTDEVSITARFLEGGQDAFLVKLSELMHGRERVEVEGPFDAVF